jgi:hypothetical protein
MNRSRDGKDHITRRPNPPTREGIVGSDFQVQYMNWGGGQGENAAHFGYPQRRDEALRVHEEGRELEADAGGAAAAGEGSTVGGLCEV